MCKVLYNCPSYSLDTRLFALSGRKYSENLETLADNLINVGIGWQIIFALIEKRIFKFRKCRTMLNDNKFFYLRNLRKDIIQG